MNDLISRKELLESIEKVSVKGNVLDDDWVYRFVQEFPSIDAVKHGRWKEVSDDMYAGGGAWICSSCHYGFSWKAYSLLPEEKYCPHCGAKMDGEE